MFKQGTPLGLEADTLAVLVPQSDGKPVIPDIVYESYRDIIDNIMSG